MLCFHMYKPRTNSEYTSHRTLYNGRNTSSGKALACCCFFPLRKCIFSIAATFWVAKLDFICCGFFLPWLVFSCLGRVFSASGGFSRRLQLFSAANMHFSASQLFLPQTRVFFTSCIFPHRGWFFHLKLFSCFQEKCVCL